MRTLCKVLAIIAIAIGVLALARFVVSGGGGPASELAGFVGAMLFGAGLLSLTILACSEPQWPHDDGPGKRDKYPDDFS